MTDRLPILQVELKGMRESLSAALLLRNEDYNKMVEQAVNSAIRGDDITELVARAVKENLNTMVRDAVWSVMGESAFREDFHQLVAQATKDVLRRLGGNGD